MSIYNTYGIRVSNNQFDPILDGNAANEADLNRLGVDEALDEADGVATANDVATIINNGREARIVRILSEAHRAFKEEIFESQGLPMTPSDCCNACIGSWALLALFIIGCVAAGNAFPDNNTLGWVTLGLGAGGGLIRLAAHSWTRATDKKEIILQLVTTAILITLGSLGGAGLLSNMQLGWGIVGTALSGCCIRSYCIAPKKTATLIPRMQPLFGQLYHAINSSANDEE